MHVVQLKVIMLFVIEFSLDMRSRAACVGFILEGGDDAMIDTILGTAKYEEKTKIKQRDDWKRGCAIGNNKFHVRSWDLGLHALEVPGLGG